MPPTVRVPDPAEHERVSGLLGVHALHALDADEAAAVEAHLGGCAACRAELSEHLDVAAMLGSMDVEPVRAGLLDDLLDRVRRPLPQGTDALPQGADVLLRGTDALSPERRDDAIAGAIALDAARVARADRSEREPQPVAAEVTPDTGTAVGDGVAPVAPVVPITAASGVDRARRRRARGLVASAALIGAAAAVPLTLALRGSAPVPSLAALADRAERAPGAQRAALKDRSGRTLATVVIGADGHGYLRGTDLVGLPAGRTYQLWAVTATAPDAPPVSAGVLGRDPSVVAFTVASPAAAYALSVEPATGSPQATTTPVALGAVD